MNLLPHDAPSSPFGVDPFATQDGAQAAAQITTQSDADMVDQLLPDAAAERDRKEQAELNRLYPKPDEQDVITLKNNLQGMWQEWRTGTNGPVQGTGDTDISDLTSNGQSTSDGIPGLMRVRTMRYHYDQMPYKYRRYMNSRYRYRSNLTATEINRTVALATRNEPRVRIAPGSRAPEAADTADRETRWAQYLLPTLERQSKQPLKRIFADGLFEGGFAGFEVFLTDSYDGIDWGEAEADESYEDYNARIDDALLRASANRLPVGVRVPDPLAVLPEFDDLGLCRLLIVELKPYRTVFSEFSRKRGQEAIDELKLPMPGTPGWPEYYDNGWGTPNGNVLTVRYYDRRWYGFMVAGKWIDGPTEHGWGEVPFIPAFGNVTSSSRIAERYQGVAWGMVEQEQVINDLITTEVDIAMTYGRPKPYIETQIGGDLRDPALGPTTVKLGNPDEAPELQIGQRLRDAFEGFGSRVPAPLLNVLMQLRQQSGMNPIGAGESPGSDPSGFAVNTLQAASQMQYEILLDNYGVAIGELIDLIRRGVKNGPINEKVFVPVQNQHGEVEYLGLGPDDITDMPSQVFVDPMNDVNRLAIRQSLIAGNQAGYVPRSLVQTQGYGADDARMWDNEIAEDIADQQLMAMALEVAKQRVAMAVPPPPAPPGGSGLVDPRGNPLSSGGGAAGDDNELRGLGGMPREDRGTGRMARSDGGQPDVAQSQLANAARSRGGQQPPNQGIPANTAG